MNRRGFLQSILAAGVAPAFVGSSVLMPVRKIVVAPNGGGLFVPEWWSKELVRQFNNETVFRKTL